jgi:SAM-dependent methyltransferase
MLNFSHNHKGLEYRNKLILQNILSGNTILDVGSNTGETSNFFYTNGFSVIGIEKSYNEFNYAVEHFGNKIKFINESLTKEFLKKHQHWDHVLLLSVIHRIFSQEGLPYVKQILKEISEKTNSIFVEGSIRHERYRGKSKCTPDFVNLNVESAVEWHLDLFNSALENFEIKFIQQIPCSEKEPFRILFHAIKK